MSRSTITNKFLHYKTQESAGGRRILLDQFVFALIPDLDVDSDVFQEELPPPDQIQYQQAVDNTGMVNENTVTYSVTMGEEVKSFDFNWIGLINKESGVLAFIIKMPVQKKMQTKDGVQGNTLTYSAVLEYAGASQATGITTPASSWQINFNDRLNGVDDLVQQNMREIYGDAVFFGDGFKIIEADLVTPDNIGGANTEAGKTLNYALLKEVILHPGVAYIQGIRTEAKHKTTVKFTRQIGQVLCIDVMFDGVLSGRHEAKFSVFIANSLSELTSRRYKDALGKTHYIQPLAEIDEFYRIKDLRPLGKSVDDNIKTIDTKISGTLDKTQKFITDYAAKNDAKIEVMKGDFLAVSKNLSEIAANGDTAKAAARLNLGLGNVAYADNELLINALDKRKNLSDLTDVAAARNNLGITEEIKKLIPAAAPAVTVGTLGKQNYNAVSITGGYIAADRVIAGNSGTGGIWSVGTTGSGVGIDTIHYSLHGCDGDIYGKVWSEFYPRLRKPPFANTALRTTPFHSLGGGSNKAKIEDGGPLSFIIRSLVTRFDINRGVDSGWVKFGTEAEVDNRPLILQWGTFVQVRTDEVVLEHLNQELGTISYVEQKKLMTITQNIAFPEKCIYANVAFKDPNKAMKTRCYTDYSDTNYIYFHIVNDAVIETSKITFSWFSLGY